MADPAENIDSQLDAELAPHIEQGVENAGVDKQDAVEATKKVKDSIAELIKDIAKQAEAEEMTKEILNNFGQEPEDTEQDEDEKKPEDKSEPKKHDKGQGEKKPEEGTKKPEEKNQEKPKEDGKKQKEDGGKKPEEGSKKPEEERERKPDEEGQEKPEADDGEKDSEEGEEKPEDGAEKPKEKEEENEPEEEEEHKKPDEENPEEDEEDQEEKNQIQQIQEEKGKLEEKLQEIQEQRKKEAKEMIDPIDKEITALKLQKSPIEAKKLTKEIKLIGMAGATLIILTIALVLAIIGLLLCWCIIGEAIWFREIEYIINHFAKMAKLRLEIALLNTVLKPIKKEIKEKENKKKKEQGEINKKYNPQIKLIVENLAQLNNQMANNRL